MEATKHTTKAAETKRRKASIAEATSMEAES